MAFEFRLPDIGEGIHEGEIVKWFVKAGDTIEEDDVLAEVQNDKSVVEIPSPVSGTIEEVLVDEGTVAVVGDIIVKIDAPDAEEMTFKGHHSDESSSDAPKEEAPQEDNAHLKKVNQQQLMLKTLKLMKIELLKQCLQYVNMHENGVNIKAVAGSGKMDVLQKKMLMHT